MALKIFPFLLLLVLQARSQAITSKIRYTSINQFGLLTGGSGEAVMAQTIHGVNKDKWFAGIGTGLDFYQARTIPLFFDVRWELSKKMNTPFVYGNLGVNFSWLSDSQKQQRQNTTSSPAKYYDMGVGWKLKGKNSRGFLFSAGYNFKQVKEKMKKMWGAPTVQLQEENYDRFNYLYRRVVIKVGIQL